jgi:Tfp pilus assembly protein PilF
MQLIDPENPTISLALAEYYRSSGKKTESFNELKKAFASPKLESELKIRILTSYLPLVSSNPDMLEQALELSKVLSETHPTEANPQAVHGDFLAINKNYEQARIQYRNALQIDKKNLQAWQQLILVESELRDFVSMETESDEALTFYPDQSVFYLFNGIAKSQNKKYEEAAKVLLAGSKLVVDNDAQLIEFYSSLGEAYNSLKRFEESDKYYEKALVIDPNNANVLNNYAYFLSERNENLEKAASMSKKSNDLVPDNSSNQDTYAWVLYKQGKYNDALAWLDKAMKNGASENGTILEHYGDVLFHLSKLDDALIYWKKAKATGDYSDKLDQKINEKRVIE